MRSCLQVTQSVPPVRGKQNYTVLYNNTGNQHMQGVYMYIYIIIYTHIVSNRAVVYHKFMSLYVCMSLDMLKC